MVRIIIILLFLFCLSCDRLHFGSSDDDWGENKKPSKTYWKSAGLIAPADRNKLGTGFKEIEHIGNRLFVMDARIRAEYSHYHNHRIYTSIIGTNVWDTLKVPNGVAPYNMKASEEGLFVGTYWTGEMWLYKPNTEEWINLNAPKPPISGNSGLNIYAIAQHNGNLIISTAGYDSATAIANVYLLQKDSSWLNISPPYDPMPFDSAKMDVPFHFFKSAEWRGNLFAITYYYGVWMYDGISWRHIPNPPAPEWSTRNYTGGARKARSITVHKDRLYVGQYYFSGIHALQDNLSEWVAVDSIRVDYPDTDSAYIATITPQHVWSLASDGENLFAAGDWSAIPMLYMGDRGEPKGWKKIDRDGWCPDGQFFCNGLVTYDMEAIGDTLYAVAWEGVYKFPISKLDSAIMGQPSYD
ncbi:hypothetical protein AGMMS49938_15810 [Fibrobacterales bacterium]|nr:hypothetical protein AGMMS49938_15810 [Fibrobacterales bacterium]